MQKISTRQLVIMALLIALNIILSRMLSIPAWNFKIGFSFVPVVIAALLFGPIGAAAVAGLGDLIGALLFPIGAYFPGFTLTAVVTGLCYGFFFYREVNTTRMILCFFTTGILCTILLNSLWISILYHAPIWTLIPGRVTQAAVMFVVHVAVTHVLAAYRTHLQPASS